MEASTSLFLILSVLALHADAYSLQVNVTNINHLDWVDVTYSTGSDEQLWIGVYSPADVDVSTIDPLPYPASEPWTATAAVKYTPYLNTSAPNGHWEFELINMYETVIFHLFSGTYEKPTLVASSPTISFNTFPPLRAHLARTQDPTEMTVTWHSWSGPDPNPMLRWGFNSGNFTESTNVVSRTYTRQDVCGAPANGAGWFSPHWWNTGKITGLTPGEMVYYVYGSMADEMWSEETSFRAASLPGPDTELRFVVTADMGMTELDGTLDHWAEPQASETADNIRNRVATGDYALVWHIGDLSYATGTESKWELFTTRLTGIADRVPYMVGLGNHESDYWDNATFPQQAFNGSLDSGGECGMGTYTRFPMPTPDGPYTGWHHFTQGPVTFITLNSELVLDEGTQQYDYLQKTLQSVDRTVTPWVLVGFHRPMYWTGPTGAIYDLHFAVIEPLLYEYQVDLVLTGHVHNAMVTCPVYNQTCITPASEGAYDAPIHVVTGNAGQDLTDIANGTYPWIQYDAVEFGYSTIHVNQTHLHMMLHRDTDDSVHFDFYIERTYPRV